MLSLALLLACETPLREPTGGSYGWTDLEIEIGVEGQPVGPNSTLLTTGDYAWIGDTGTPREDEDTSGPWEPLLVDSNGDEVQLVSAPYAAHWEPYVDDTDHDLRWIAPQGLLSGETYTLSEMMSADNAEWPYPLDEPVSFTVEEMATDTLSLAEGDVFLVQGYRLQILDSILQDQGSSWLRVGEVTEDRVRMELIIESDFRCRAVNAWVDRRDGGLRWQAQELTIPYSDDIELVGQGIFVDLPLSAAGDFVSGQASMTVQAQGFDRLMAVSNDDWADGDTCDLIATVGADCGECLDGEGQCRHFYLSDLYAQRLSDADAAAFDAELPTCGVDASNLELPVIDLSGLELDCGCTTAAGFSSMSLGWLALALVRTRRRKKRRDEEDVKQA